jgi:hypothetical protein
MAFRDLDDFLVVKPVVLPIRGKDYAFPGEISARSWLLLQSVAEKLQQAQASGGEFDPDEQTVSDADEADLREELLGGVDEEMVADGLTSAHIKAVFYALIAYHLSGLEAAEAVWNAQGEAPAPSREARRKSMPAKSTRSRGSRAGSNGPKAVAAKAAPGARSSGAGS